MPNFIDKIAVSNNVNDQSLTYLYMELKTKASDRDSKSRRSLGNLYAMYVLCQDYISGNIEGSRFTDLMARMKNMPFGSKLQNHPLDNRLNDEVRRKFIDTNSGLNNSFLPVVPVLKEGKKGRKISESFLSYNNNSPLDGAKFIVDVVDAYISIIDQNQTEYLNEIASTDSIEQTIVVVKKAFNYESDARLFEIVSHAILYIAYKRVTAEITLSSGGTIAEPLSLYKTGRTNANDGGIDFVLKPIGRFFQVTETLDFKKYFLDFDKMNRFPVTFVIKTDKSADETIAKIKKDATTQLGSEKALPYLSLFEEVITNNELLEHLDTIKSSPSEVEELKQTIISSYQLEFGLLD